VARAKRTDRTDARRRHRAEQASVAAAEAETRSAAATPAKGAAKPATTPPRQRASIRSAFGGAMRPLDLRGDLRAAPRVLTHWGVLAAVGVAVASSIVFVLSTNELAQTIDWTAADPYAGKQLGTVSNLSYLAFSLFVAPPPAAGGFLIGFTAKRASWLGGLVFGIAATICYIGVLQTPAGLLLTGGQPANAAIANAAAIAPLGAALFASLAAWYRRFLELANPNRNQRQQAQAKKTSGRGDMKPVRR
jgi:hypothetical protein